MAAFSERMNRLEASDRPSGAKAKTQPNGV